MSIVRTDPFLYLALTIPHVNNEGTRMFGDGAEVPDYGIYADKDWPKQDKGQAAMITSLDKDVSRLLDLLKELGRAENTLVLFSSDNGPHDEAGHNPGRFATACELTGAKLPDGLDSISFAPTLTGQGRQPQHEYLYWEFHEQGSRQAVRFGDWKAIRQPMLTGDVKRYNLKDDLAEQHDVAAANSRLVQQAAKLMDEAHVPDERWKVRGE